jgi:ribonuclease Z
MAAVAIWLVPLVAVLVIGGVILSETIETAMLTNVIKQRFISQAEKWPDGLYAGLAGSGGPLPEASRVQTCVGVVAGEHTYIVDAGEGGVRNLSLMGFKLGRADAVLLTHFHSDHIADLGELMLQHWAGGSNDKPLDVIGPAGVESVVAGFNQAYKLDAGYRVAHHGEKTVPPSGAGGLAKPFSLSAEEDASTVIIDRDGVRITAFKVNHAPVYPAVGYRFDYKGRSLVLSGDTMPTESVKKYSRGADILFHDAMQVTMIKLINEQAGLSYSPSLGKITADIPSYHTTPEDAARIAEEAGVKQLVYYHISPPIPNPILNNVFMGDAAKYFKGPITIGTDGLLIYLPAGSDKIEAKKTL